MQRPVWLLVLWSFATFSLVAESQESRKEAKRSTSQDSKAGSDKDKESPKQGPAKQVVPAKKAARRTLPAAAKALEYTKCVIDEKPVAEDIATERTGEHKWFSGQWWMNDPPSAEHYANARGKLTLSLHGNLVTAPRDFKPGKLPYLPGADGFYVEFDVHLSDEHPDHCPALFLMPIEHSWSQEDHASFPFYEASLPKSA
jgi:hypothetical protein